MLWQLFLFLCTPAWAYEPGKHYVLGGAGASSVHSYEAAASLEYFYFPMGGAHSFGMRVDRAFGSPSTTVVSLPVGGMLGCGHACLNLRVIAAPGLRFAPGRTDFAFLLGIGRWFELGDWRVQPSIAVDVTVREATSFFGLQVGRGF